LGSVCRSMAIGVRSTPSDAERGSVRRIRVRILSRRLFFLCWSCIMKSNQQSKKRGKIPKVGNGIFECTVFYTNLHTNTPVVFLFRCPQKIFKKETATILTYFNSFLDVLGEKSNFQMALSFGQRTNKMKYKVFK
jgi:hypothetical protein